MTTPQKVLTVVGARPQFIKASVVSLALRQQSALCEVLVHTGQHYDEQLSQVFFDELELPAPQHHLGVGSGTHGVQTARMLEGLERVMRAEQPDWVLVYGDTNSTLAGALAAAKLQVPIAHVEAGVRSFNRRMPEEVNRVLTDHAADLLLAPTATAVQLLEREGIEPRRIRLTGDVMYDVVRHAAQRAEQVSQVLTRLQLTPQAYVLATVHRPDNTDLPQRLRAIVEALEQIAEQTPVVVPLHPRTRKALDVLGYVPRGRLKLIEPVRYHDMAMLQQHAQLIVTDSGGLQKEAYFYGVPCLILRAETEWTELIERGHRLHQPEDAATLIRIIGEMLAHSPRITPDMSLFGDGHAAEKIVAALRDFPA